MVPGPDPSGSSGDPVVDPAVGVVLSRTLARPPLSGGGRLVCIDGPAGSGKTTLAASVAEAWSGSVVVLHMDDLYQGWDGLRFPELGERVHRWVGAPYAAGTPGSYRRWDWHRDTWAESHAVPPVDLLVLEGVGSGCRQLAAVRTLLVWVAAPEDLRVERGIARDRAQFAREGAAFDEKAHRERWREFVADERDYFVAHGLPGAADLHVDGTRSLPLR